MDQELTALDGQAIASQKADVAAPPSSTDDEQRRTLESQLSAAQKKLDDLRARYTDEYPDVESTKDDVTEIRRKLASLPPVSNAGERAASPPKLDADANETDKLRLERARLMQAILVEKRREAGLRDQTRSSVGNSALAVPRHQTPSRDRSGNVPSHWCGSREMPAWVKARAAYCGTCHWRGHSADFCIWVLQCGGTGPIERAAQLEQPMLNNKLTAEKASEYAGSFIHNEDRWPERSLRISRSHHYWPRVSRKP